jgi:bifunctional non-homologous end joining protein LigD
MGLPYVERRSLLAELQLSGESWQTPEHVVGDGSELLKASVEQRLEGIVAKRLDSIYQPGQRATSWIKIKTMGRQEFVIGGWLPGKGRRSETIGALLLGVHDPDGTLRHVGRVGTGFSDRELSRLGRLLAPLKRESSPFGAGERPPREAVFVEPRLVAEVEFAEWTSAGNIRHPSYKGLREDKDPSAVVREDLRAGPPAAHAAAEQEPKRSARAAGAAKGRRAAAAPPPPPPPRSIVPDGQASAVVEIDGRELKLTNLQKVLYPKTGFTKGQVIDYYARVSPVLLPHLKDRPLTVTRWPDGVEAKSFFQKQSPAHRPEWVRTATVPANDKPIDYTLADDEPTLIWLANLAAIELHTPLARAAAMDRPTAVVFDLDPGAPAGIVECCRVARRLHALFEGLGLESFVKTSGSKGLQLYVPLNHPAARYDRTKPFAKAVAELLESDESELVVSRMTKTRRAGKVLIDWSQNDAKKTTVCAYSLRAVAHPSVSTPLRWEEVEDVIDSGDGEPLGFQAADVLARVAEHGDLLAPVLSLVQELPQF